MPDERRQNDIIILEKLGEIKTNLALNTEKTAQLAEYQKTLNGKVVAHETRLQQIESTTALTTSNLAQMVSDRNAHDKETVTQTEFDPIRKIVYGVVALILIAFATALVALVIKA